MKKETIEANDLKFRENLQELRSRLISRRQSKQIYRKPHSLMKPVIAVLLIISAAIYISVQKFQSHQSPASPVSDKLQIARPMPSSPSVSKFDEQKSSQKAAPEIENSKNPYSRVTLNAAFINLSPELAAVFDLLSDISFETQVEMLVEKSGSEKSPGAVSSLKADKETLKISEHAPVDSTPEITKSPPSHSGKISRILTCAGVKSLTCVEPRSVFALNGKEIPHVWMEVHSNKFPYILRHVYYHEGEKYCEVPLEIKYPRMRTWSNITLKNPKYIGAWHVKIVTEDGKIMQQTDFEVISAD